MQLERFGAKVPKEVIGFHQVREAARDSETYSSDLLGDRDTRSYRQLPLEADGERHQLFRQAVSPFFLSVAIAPKKPLFEEHAKKLIAAINAKGSGDITSDLALPYVIGCLTIIYNRPQDYEEWLSWGPDVWTAKSHMEELRNPGKKVEHVREGGVLQAYLDRVFDYAHAHPVVDEEKQDVWDYVSQIKIGDEPISRLEMQGIANVLLAGGRDTVIKLVTGLTWHLIGNPSDRDFLRDNDQWFNRTVSEMVRYLTPLPNMERVLPEDRTPSDADRKPENYVLLSFVSANHDKSIWPDPEVVNIHRDRKPHLGFGFGPHTCMGMHMTEHEAASLLTVLLNEWPNWQFDGEPEIAWGEAQGVDGETVRFIDRFDSLRVKVSN